MAHSMIRAALLAALALLGGELAAGVVKIVNASEGTWTLARVRPATPMKALIIGPGTTQAIALEPGSGDLALADGQGRFCMLGWSEQVAAPMGALGLKVLGHGMDLEVAFSPDSKETELRILSEEELRNRFFDKLAALFKGMGAQRPGPAPQEDLDSRVEAIEPEADEAKRPEKTLTDDRPLLPSCSGGDSTGSRPAAQEGAAPAVAPLLRKYTLLLRNATLALVESHEEEALARGPRAQPTAPSKRERRHCGFEVKRALTALHDCGNELEAAHSALDGSADAAQARILKREAQRVKALLALAEERLGSV